MPFIASHATLSRQSCTTYHMTKRMERIRKDLSRIRGTYPRRHVTAHEHPISTCTAPCPKDALANNVWKSEIGMSLRENSTERRRKSSSLQERKNKTSVFIWFLFFFRIIFAIAFNSPLIGRLLLLWRVRHVRITRAWWPYSPLDYIRQSCVGAQRIRDYLAS